MSIQISVVRLSAACVFVLATAACDQQQVEADEELDFRERTSPEEPAPEVPPVIASELRDAACPANRQVARRTAESTSCPSVTNWAKEQLFVPQAPLELVDGNSPLEEYCRYTWIGQGAPDLSLLHPDKTPELRPGIDPDCGVVFPQTDPAPEFDAMWLALDPGIEDLFHYGIGLVDGADLAKLPSNRYPVQVSVIDTVPDPAPADPHSDHGALMAALVNDIACPVDPSTSSTSSCAVTIKHSLGLPRATLGQVDVQHGGWWGTQADLAKAIFRTVETWRATNIWPNGQKPKLVLSLSLGFEDEFFSGDNSSVPTRPVKAIYDAIQAASCQGVVVIAAAGNQGHLCTEGPLAPATWETHPAPDATRCAELGVGYDAAAVGGIYQPLLYSVGGLTHAGQPLANARVGGMPRLATTASHAPAGGDSTVLTGSSVAAATVAGAAALALSYRPDLPTGALMNSIYRSGTTVWESQAAATPLTADYIGPGTVSDTVHQVNVCAALDDVCTRPGSSCVPTAPLPCLTAPAPASVADLFADLSLIAITPGWEFQPDFGDIGDEWQCAAECGLPASGYTSFVSGGDPCPTPIVPTMPYTEPQPKEVGCPDCWIDASQAILYASIDPDFHDVKINGATVSVSNAAEVVYFRLDMDVVHLSTTEITKIALDSALMPPNPTSAMISIDFAGELRLIDNDLLLE